MKIWVDDIRTPPEGWVWWQTSTQALNGLGQLRYGEQGILVPELMSLDHDLGEGDTTRPIVIWMIENEFWPVEVRVHSQNPVGRHWLESMIDRYKPRQKNTYQSTARNQSL